MNVNHDQLSQLRTAPMHRRSTVAVGALLALVGGALGALTTMGHASPNESAAQAQYERPVNTSAPTIAGTPREGETLTANTGTWSGTQPIVFTNQWQRCNPAGQQCGNIPGADDQTYRLVTADVGNTLRVIVTGTNPGGSNSATSAPTARVTQAGPTGQIRLAGGQISIPVTSVNRPERLIVSRVAFAPNPVQARGVPITAQVRVVDTRGFVVRGALVFLRSVPLLTTTPPEQATETNGFVTFRVFPSARFPLRTGFNVQFFVRARKPGDNVLAGVSSRRLVQVRTATPR